MSRPVALLFIALALVATACASDESSTGPDRGAYLTLLGNDTLVMEWMEFGEGYVEADALIRGNRTTWNEYRLEYGPDGAVTAWEAAVYPGAPGATEPLQTQRLVRDDQGTRLVISRGGEEQTRDLEVAAGEVPFVDFLHWPFEAALRRQAESGMPGDDVTIFGGRTFEIESNDGGSWTLLHPSRGPSTFEMDDRGRITALDGTGSTRAYLLSRTDHDALDPATMRARFADRPLGELSGRGEIDATVAGVNFFGDYGTPERRGREIFGRLVAYGERWRTGANRATHLSFDGDIVIDGETVPAGDYTLYTIPEEDGGTLIINRRTGQTGTSYDEEMDQARVELRRESLDDSVEVFEIRVVPAADEGGRIELRWAETVYFVPFTAG